MMMMLNCFKGSHDTACMILRSALYKYKGSRIWYIENQFIKCELNKWTVNDFVVDKCVIRLIFHLGYLLQQCIRHIVDVSNVLNREYATLTLMWGALGLTPPRR
jgi:hypothetical protein